MMIEDLQTAAWVSVESRGFFKDTNIPAACRNMHQMETFLVNVEQLGRLARFVRKNQSIATAMPSDNELMCNPLLLAQFVRLVEEVGELAAAIADGNKSAAVTESADVYVTNANVHTSLGARLETSVMAKLIADEQRGIMHGEVVK